MKMEHEPPQWPVVSRADVGQALFVVGHDLGASEVANFQNFRRCIDQQIFGLDVSVADGRCMQEAQSSKQLEAII